MAHAKTYVKRGQPNKPKILQKQFIVGFRVKYRMLLGLQYYAEARGTNMSRIIFEALEYYFKYVLPKLKQKKNYVERRKTIDYSKVPTIDYAFMFHDHIGVPDLGDLLEYDREEFYDDE